MDEILKVIILGIVEGVTEFLPISSTGHLIVATDILNLRESLLGTFEIFIQIGAVFAVIGYYRRDLWQQATHIHTDSDTQQLWLGVAIAFVPAAVLGLLFKDFIDAVLFSPTAVAIGLIVGGVLFIVVERRRKPDADADTADDTDDETAPDDAPLTLRQALWVGLWQVLALFPGMSRSGMSIIGGMIAGVSRKRATQFSFYLSIPTLGGATVYTLLDDLAAINRSDLALLALGAAVSMVIAWLAIDWLLRYVSSNDFVPFGYYRIIVGIVILAVTVFNAA